MGPNNFESQIASMQTHGYNTSGSSSSAGNAIGAAGAILGGLELAYNMYANSKNTQAQYLLNKKAQSNFENQFQIMSNDLQKAGFNPSVLAGGVNNSTPPSFSAPQRQPMDISGLASLLSAINESKLTESQVKLNHAESDKLFAEASHTRGDFDFRSAERLASERFAASEAEKTRQHENHMNERRLLEDKWKTEYSLWWKDNQNKIERNFQRDLFKGNKKFDLIMADAKYQADLNIRKLAHDFQLSEDSWRGFIYQTAEKMLNDQKFKQRLIEAQNDYDYQIGLMKEKFKQMYQYDKDTMWITQLNSANDALFGALGETLAQFGAWSRKAR